MQKPHWAPRRWGSWAIGWSMKLWVHIATGVCRCALGASEGIRSVVMFWECSSWQHTLQVLGSLGRCVGCRCVCVGPQGATSWVLFTAYPI